MRLAKGYWGARHRLLRTVKETLLRAGQFAYRDRRVRKRTFRRLWIVRINAAARANGMTYSRLIAGLNKAGLALDRKTLSEVAFHDPAAFTGLVERARSALAG